jgi:hypothetical protein
VAFLPRPFHPFHDPPPPAQALSHTSPIYTPVPRSKHKSSVSSPVRSHPCSSKSKVGSARGLVPSIVSGGAPAIFGHKRVFVNDLLPLSPSRAAVYFG